MNARPSQFNELVDPAQSRAVEITLNADASAPSAMIRTRLSMRELNAVISTKGAICCVSHGEPWVIPWHSVSTIRIMED